MYINTLKLIAMLVKLKALKHVICTGSGSMYARQSGRGSECELSEKHFLVTWIWTRSTLFSSHFRRQIHCSPCNALAPTYTGLHFHSVRISTCRATSGQRGHSEQRYPYSSFASLNFPPFIRRTAGWTSIVTSENLACLALQMSPIYLCTFLPWQDESLEKWPPSYHTAECWLI